MEEARENKRILLTGGHAATTAMAVVQEINKTKSWKVFWLGPRSAIDGKKVATLESKILPKLGVTTYEITSGKLHRRFSFQAIVSLIKIPISLLQAFGVLLKVRPDLTFSFGGSTAGVVVVASWILGIPVIIHDQTAHPGRANLLSSRFAKEILVARTTALSFFKGKKVTLVGNPILEEISSLPKKSKLSKVPTIFITCGSRGSKIINNVVKGALPGLLTSFKVIHQTGESDFSEFSEIKKKLDSDQSKRYEIHPQVDPTKMADYYRDSDVVIARGGANTISEIVTVGIPSIIIPIPWSYGNEQEKNAQFAKDHGVAEIISQDHLSSEMLLSTLSRVIENWSKMIQSENYNIDKSASKLVVSKIDEIL